MFCLFYIQMSLSLLDLESTWAKDNWSSMKRVLSVVDQQKPFIVWQKVYERRVWILLIIHFPK